VDARQDRGMTGSNLRLKESTGIVKTLIVFVVRATAERVPIKRTLNGPDVVYNRTGPNY